MLLKLLTVLFDQLIGKVPENKKRELRRVFLSVLEEAVSAAAEGAVRGARNA